MTPLGTVGQLLLGRRALGKDRWGKSIVRILFRSIEEGFEPEKKD
jgi:hypothetical protein